MTDLDDIPLEDREEPGRACDEIFAGLSTSAPISSEATAPAAPAATANAREAGTVGAESEEGKHGRKKAAEPVEVDSTDRRLSRALKSLFYAGRAGYALRTGETFIPIPAEGQAKHHLMRMGWRSEELPFLLCEIREKNFVVYAGPMPGFRPGLYDVEDAAGKFLVTVGPKIIAASQGECSTILRVIDGLVHDPDHPTQKHAVLAWLKVARENVVAARRRPLPALALVGPREGGKSLLLDIARVCTGGRMVSALLGLTRESGFNAELLQGELLVIDDERASKDHRARTRLAQGIKTTLFAGAVRIEQKHRDPFTCRPVHALALAVNSEPEHVQILPSFDDSLADKLSLIKTSRANLTQEELSDRDELWRKIVSEVPAFVHRLERWRIPEELLNARTGAAAFQHPDVLRLLSEISPENRLLELIRQSPKILHEIDLSGFWRGTAAELESALTESDVTRHPSRQLLSWSGAAGAYLSRLADAGTNRIEKAGQRGGVQTYRIGPVKE